MTDNDNQNTPADQFLNEYARYYPALRDLARAIQDEQAEEIEQHNDQFPNASTLPNHLEPDPCEAMAQQLVTCIGLLRVAQQRLTPIVNAFQFDEDVKRAAGHQPIFILNIDRHFSRLSGIWATNPHPDLVNNVMTVDDLKKLAELAAQISAAIGESVR